MRTRYQDKEERSVFDRCCDLALALAVLYFGAHAVAWLIRL